MLKMNFYLEREKGLSVTGQFMPATLLRPGYDPIATPRFTSIILFFTVIFLSGKCHRTSPYLFSNKSIDNEDQKSESTSEKSCIHSVDAFFSHFNTTIFILLLTTT